MTDNPKLTTRLVKGTNPIRVVLSESGNVPADRALFTDMAAPSYVATSERAARNSGGKFKVIALGNDEQGLSIEELLRKLGKMGVMTVLVEGGAGVLTSFIKQRQVDKIVVCVAPMIIGQGIESIGDLGIEKLDNAIKLENVKTAKSGPDLIVSADPVWS
jgi:riboflavin-specific deaminase-like protein